MKATYIGKYVDLSYGQCMVYLEYEYRGERYTVYENRCKGNEPLSWQHRSEQDRIDRMLDTSAKAPEDAQVGFDKLWNYFETGEWEDNTHDRL